MWIFLAQPLFATHLPPADVWLFCCRPFQKTNFSDQKGNKHMNDTFMKEKPVLPLIASMALPMVISMLVNSDRKSVV